MIIDQSNKHRSVMKTNSYSVRLTGWVLRTPKFTLLIITLSYEINDLKKKLKFKITK